MPKVAKEKASPLDNLLEVKTVALTLRVMGRGNQGIILNRLSEKTRHELLLPSTKKNMAERATFLKHDPHAEFRASPHRLVAGPTLLGLPSASFKKAMMTAALDLPSTKKAQIGRLIWVEDRYVSLYGVPQIILAPVRSADMAHTPDIRSRAIIPEWACELTVTYAEPLIKEGAILRLLHAAGVFIGVGDWRNEKGSGTFGSFQIVDPRDAAQTARFERIVAEGGRQAQEEAMLAPQYYDDDTAEMLTWFDNEITKRTAKGIGATRAKSDGLDDDLVTIAAPA